jgi:hypothetical protein
VLRPVVASLAGSLVDVTGGVPFQWTGPTAAVTAANMGSRPVDVTLNLDVTGNGESDRTVTISAPNMQTQKVEVSASQSQAVTIHLALPPGRTQVLLEATGGTATIPGTEGQVRASLKISDFQLSSTADVNAATLQQFAEATPPSLR